MKILISIHYIVNGIKTLQSGYFSVNVRAYKEDPKKEAARAAQKWFREIKRSLIYKATLYKVLYNEIDITEEVKELEEWRLNLGDN